MNKTEALEVLQERNRNAFPDLTSEAIDIVLAALAASEQRERVLREAIEKARPLVDALITMTNTPPDVVDDCGLDTERYRWLRDRRNTSIDVIDADEDYLYGEIMDRAIDKARKGEGE